jgi:hypothetical protein
MISPAVDAHVTIGINVAEPRNGLDLVALDDGRHGLAGHGRLTLEEAARITLALRPAVVCIDSTRPSAHSPA